jgi:hypothetical protein
MIGSQAERLRELVGDVAGARHAFGVRDSDGNGMDTAKVIEDPAGGYLAVYHSWRAGVFSVGLATSPDLVRWTHRCDCAAHASQPYLTALPGGGFVAAWETDTARYNYLSFRYYPTRDDLLAGTATRAFDAPHTLVPAGRWAEGTPSIDTVRLEPDIDHSTVEVGFHYWRNGDVDRQARGTLTGFSSCTTRPEPGLDAAVLVHGVRGNVGARDAVVIGGEAFVVIEGQYVKGDFGSWRLFLYDPRSGTADPLPVRTPGGSRAFANPALTVLRGPGGEPTLVTSLFVPGDGAAPGEAGQLVYHRPLAGG